jgi:hypothetical protein
MADADARVWVANRTSTNAKDYLVSSKTFRYALSPAGSRLSIR